MASDDNAPSNTGERKPDVDVSNAQSVRRELHWLEKLNLTGQILLLVVGTIAVFIYHGQLQEMRVANQNTNDAIRVARDTLVEAQRNDAQQRVDNAIAQKSASESLQATIEDFQLDERPYLSVALTGTPGNLTVLTSGQHAGQVEFGMPVQNFGKTPAIVVGKYVHMAVGLEEVKKISSHNSTDKQTNILPPGDKQPVYIYSRVIAPNNTAPGAQVTLPYPIVIYGHIEYKSVFEQRKQPYVLSFCSEITNDPSNRERTKYCEGRNFIK